MNHYPTSTSTDSTRTMHIASQASRCYQLSEPIWFPSTIWSRFGPIITMEAFLSFTVFMFAFGPWPWPVTNPFTLYTYLIAVQVMLFLGYWSGTSRDGSGAVYTGQLTDSSRLFNTSMALNVVWLFPFFYLMMGSGALSMHGIVQHLLLGVTNPREAYTGKFDDMATKNNLVLYAYMLCSPFLWLAVPLAIHRWHKISKSMKATVFLVVLANAATWVAVGTMKGIADSAATIAIAIAARGQMTHRRQMMQRKIGRAKRIVSVLAAILVMLVYFSYAENSRKEGHLVLYDPGPGISLDVNNVFIAGLPISVQATEAYAISYLCQGYYGLSLALQQPFVWSYGIGHSVVATSIVRKLTGFDAAELTYMAREEQYGWSMQTRWDSIYPWLASDVTFPGTLIIIFLIGRLLAATWGDTRADQSPYALPLFVMTMLMICYFPANDQFLSASTTVLAFWGLLFLWWANRNPKVRRWPQRVS